MNKIDEVNLMGQIIGKENPIDPEWFSPDGITWAARETEESYRMDWDRKRARIAEAVKAYGMTASDYTKGMEYIYNEIKGSN